VRPAKEKWLTRPAGACHGVVHQNVEWRRCYG
jgi:hypothetical protein